jgi:hypothetical protein
MQTFNESNESLLFSSTVFFNSASSPMIPLTESVKPARNPVSSSGLFSPVLGLAAISFSELYTPTSFSSRCFFFTRDFLVPSIIISISSLSPFDV